MNCNEYKDKLNSNVNGIPAEQKLQFAIEICDKLLPDYQNFSELYKWGEINPLKDGLKYCKEFANGIELEFDSVKMLIKRIEKNTPDSEDFGQVSGSLALNAASAICETLNFIIDKKNERIVDIGNFSYDTEYFKLGERKSNLSDSELEKEIELQKEIEWQLRKTKNVA